MISTTITQLSRLQDRHITNRIFDGRGSRLEDGKHTRELLTDYANRKIIAVKYGVFRFLGHRTNLKVAVSLTPWWLCSRCKGLKFSGERASVGNIFISNHWGQFPNFSLLPLICCYFV